MTGDLLLTWMSETGEGRLRDLRGRVEWLARTHALRSDRRTVGRWLRDVSALGHAEVDWEADRWCVAPPVLSRLPRADGVAVLAGARRPEVLERLARTDLALTDHVLVRLGQLSLPRVTLAQFDSSSSLRSSAEEAGIHYVGCFPERFADSLPKVAVAARTAPPATTNDTLHRRTGPGPREWAPVSAAGSPFPDGLYRVELNGREEYRTVRFEQWYRCTLADGVWLEHARTGENCLRWRAEQGVGREDVGRLFVDFGAPLPPLQARVLTLCSGLPPQLNDAGETLAYRNVPRQIARRVAASLVQPLAEET